MSADISRSCIAKNFKTVGHFTNSPLADLFHLRDAKDITREVAPTTLFQLKLYVSV